jgi:hypothetical protein
MNNSQTRRNNALRVLAREQRAHNLPEYARTMSTLATASRRHANLAREQGNTLQNVRNYGKFLNALKKLHKLILETNAAFFKHASAAISLYDNPNFVPVFRTNFQKVWDQFDVCDEYFIALNYFEAPLTRPTRRKGTTAENLYNDLHNHMLELAPIETHVAQDGSRTAVPKITSYDDVVKGIGFTSFFQLWVEKIIPHVERLGYTTS